MDEMSYSGSGFQFAFLGESSVPMLLIMARRRDSIFGFWLFGDTLIIIRQGDDHQNKKDL
jgi:hypothetical protein